MVKITPEEILKRNPKVDADALRELKALSERLAEFGGDRKRYELGSPYEIRSNPVSETKSADRRHVLLDATRCADL